MLKLKRNMLFMALASATLMVSAGAYAQAAEEATDAAPTTETAAQREAKRKAAAEEKAAQMDVVEVTGIRRGIESAISLKQESTSIIEAISAEDIGKLPDSSIAESIARLPGLAAQRVAGRATTISIRGLAGDFSTTLLNGREQVSSGDNRSVEFDQYPSELLNSVVVYKTPDPTLVAQGISGTVDLQTVRPLAIGKRVVSVNARYDENSTGEVNPGYDDNGYRLSASYIDQFADDTIGIAIGYARLDSPRPGRALECLGLGAHHGGRHAGRRDADRLADLRHLDREHPRRSDGGGRMGAERQLHRLARHLLLEVRAHRDHPRPGSGPVPGVDRFDPDQSGHRQRLLTSGTFAGIRPVIRNDENARDDDIFAIGFINEYTFNDYWSGMADFSMSKAKRDESILETYAGAAATDTVNVQVDRNGFPTFDFGLDYRDPGVVQLRDPGGWGQDGYVKYPEFEDELNSARFTLTRALDNSFLSSFDFGSNYSNRTKSRAVAESFLDLLNGRAPVAVPSNLLVGPVRTGFAGVPGVLSYSAPGAARSLYQTRTNINQDILNKDWEVDETVITSFFKLNIDGLIGEIPVRGNVGFQYVNAEQESEGFAVPGGNASRRPAVQGRHRLRRFPAEPQPDLLADRRPVGALRRRQAGVASAHGSDARQQRLWHRSQPQRMERWRRQSGARAVACDQLRLVLGVLPVRRQGLYQRRGLPQGPGLVHLRSGGSPSSTSACSI